MMKEIRKGSLERRYESTTKIAWFMIIAFIITLILPKSIIAEIAFQAAKILFYINLLLMFLQIVEYHIRLERHENQQDAEEIANKTNPVDSYKPPSTPSETFRPGPDEQPRDDERKEVKNIRP